MNDQQNLLNLINIRLRSGTILRSGGEIRNPLPPVEEEIVREEHLVQEEEVDNNVPFHNDLDDAYFQLRQLFNEPETQQRIAIMATEIFLEDPYE